MTSYAFVLVPLSEGVGKRGLVLSHVSLFSNTLTIRQTGVGHGNPTYHLRAFSSFVLFVIRFIVWM